MSVLLSSPYLSLMTWWNDDKEMEKNEVMMVWMRQVCKGWRKGNVMRWRGMHRYTDLQEWRRIHFCDDPYEWRYCWSETKKGEEEGVGEIGFHCDMRVYEMIRWGDYCGEYVVHGTDSGVWLEATWKRIQDWEVNDTSSLIRWQVIGSIREVSEEVDSGKNEVFSRSKWIRWNPKWPQSPETKEWLITM